VAGAQAHGEGEGDVVDDELGYLYPTAMIEGQAQQGEDNEFEEDVVGEEADFNEDKLPSLAAIEKDLEKIVKEQGAKNLDSQTPENQVNENQSLAPESTSNEDNEDSSIEKNPNNKKSNKKIPQRTPIVPAVE
jgi:hypothetical protein